MSILKRLDDPYLPLFGVMTVLVMGFLAYSLNHPGILAAIDPIEIKTTMPVKKHGVDKKTEEQWKKMASELGVAY